MVVIHINNVFGAALGLLALSLFIKIRETYVKENEMAFMKKNF
jgi:hypothetical protein